MNLIFLILIFLIYKIRKCDHIRDVQYTATLSARVLGSQS